MFGTGLTAGSGRTLFTTLPMALPALVKPSPIGSVDWWDTQLARLSREREAMSLIVVFMWR